MLVTRLHGAKCYRTLNRDGWTRRSNEFLTRNGWARRLNVIVEGERRSRTNDCATIRWRPLISININETATRHAAGHVAARMHDALGAAHSHVQNYASKMAIKRACRGWSPTPFCFLYRFRVLAYIFVPHLLITFTDVLMCVAPERA